MQVGREFTNPSNVALQPGLIEENLKGGLKVGGTELRAEHSRQDFELLGIGRQHTRVGIVETIGSAFQVDAGVANDQVSGGSPPSSDVTAGELKTKWGPTPKLQLWTEARRHFSLSGPDIAPEVLGFGGTYRVAPSVALEASQRYVSRSDSLGNYAISSIGVRSDMGHGTQAWGSYQLIGDVAFDASLALLTRQQFSQDARSGAPLSRQLSSLWGLAFRPAHSDRLNMLAKFQWTDSRNPLGAGVLVSQGAERKLIGAAELIWAPGPTLGIGTR